MNKQVRHEMDTTGVILAILAIMAIVGLATSCAGYQETKFVAGPAGARGSDGQSIVGPKGDSGATGADGKIATIVQLCPGAPAYPAVFVEVAMCINDQLYAVYSANDGFLTLLPPGAYSSNAIGSACNLTVAEHCVVTN